MSELLSNCKSSKSEQTKQKIINAFLDLIGIKKWDKITVKELCSQTEITRGTFYQYFSDIYDLMEQIETALLDSLSLEYQKATKEKLAPYSIDKFLDKFDYSAPQTLTTWFLFCKKHKKEVAVLLDPQNGDVYFVQKLKKLLGQYINQMMDDDGHPQDALRTHFAKIFTEMHFLAARSWLESNEEDTLSITDIINLLNTMRVGSNYLRYREFTSPDFKIKMNVPENDEGD